MDERICDSCGLIYFHAPITCVGQGPRRGADVLVTACSWQCLLDELRRRALAV